MKYQENIGLLGFLTLWCTTFGIYALSLLLNIIIAATIGAFAGWLLSLFFLGGWITSGLDLLGVAVRAGDLYKLGSLLGFASGLTKGQFSIKK